MMKFKKHFFLSMYLAYKNELIPYQPSWANETLEESKDRINTWLFEKGYHVLPVHDNPSSPIIGFVIIAENGTEDCHPDTDYYIVQTYVIPACRKKGYAIKTLRDFINNHPGLYGFDIIKGNPVEGFWKKVFQDGKAVTLPRVREPELENELDLYGYIMKRNT